MPPKAKAVAKGKARAKAKAKAKAKALAGRRRFRRPAGEALEAPPELPGGGSSGGFVAIAEDSLKREGRYHLKGSYLNSVAEVTVKIDSLIEDSLGKWGQVTLLGTNHEPLREWRLQNTNPLFVSRGVVGTDHQTPSPELFYSREFKEVDETVPWALNLKDQTSHGGFLGIQQLAQDLGFGGAAPGAEANNTAPDGVGETEKKKKKRLRGKERVKAMLRLSQWNWKDTSLDPKFRRPKIRLKRKRDETRSSSSEATQESRDSEGEDLFPEEDQIKYIHRKCPGLLTRHGIRQGKERVLALQGEGATAKDPEPVFVRYHRQVFAPLTSSAPLKREHLTLSSVLDCILRGEILRGSDILVQRLKSLEQMAQGAPAHLALKLEILPPENSTLASSEEARTAAAEHHKELKLASNWKGKGKNATWFPQASPASQPSQTLWTPSTGKGAKGYKGNYNNKGGQGKDKGERGGKGEQAGKTVVMAPF